tara:strand:- start:80642 stop:81202 length:561 start_codon:yes stop_codon:yes gene_type:complete
MFSLIGKEQPVSDSLIDALGFARAGSFLQGQAPLGLFARMLEGQLVQPEAQRESFVNWTLEGENTASGRYFLHVTAHAEPMLECQRCLRPFICKINVDNRVELVRTPAEQDSDDLDDDGIERIVGSKRFSVLGFVEDELILAMPYVPKHHECPSDSGIQADRSASSQEQETRRQSPFSVLEQLKKN